MENQEIVELLVDHEEAIGKLYQAYSKRFTDKRDFWNKIADEEQQHANWIRKILARILDGEGTIKKDKFNFAVLTESIAGIQETTKRVPKPDFTYTNALFMALWCEEGLLENKYFDIFEGNCAEIKQVQYYLNDAVQNHCRRIRDLINEENKRGVDI